MPVSQLKIGALLSYVVLALQNLVGLLYTPFMLRMMGKSEYGLYSIAASIVAYLTILDLGFGNAIVRYTAKYRAEGKTDEQYKMFGMFFLLYCGIGLLAMFRDASYVVTDSFHGTVFSIIFGKEFKCIYNEGRGAARFKSLMNLYNSGKLEEMREFSLNWLKTALEK